MPFRKGISGNPGGRTRKGWIQEQERFREARRSWRRLIEIRDGLVLERKSITNAAGEVTHVDVVSSIKDEIACCKEILNRAIGLPAQFVEGHVQQVGIVLQVNVDPLARPDE